MRPPSGVAGLRGVVGAEDASRRPQDNHQGGGGGGWTTKRAQASAEGPGGAVLGERVMVSWESNLAGPHFFLVFKISNTGFVNGGY